MIAIHGSSDYGFYGKTGDFEPDGFFVSQCECGNSPLLRCQYDDTVGFKETTYKIICKCGIEGYESGNINRSINEWNKTMFKCDELFKAYSTLEKMEDYLFSRINSILGDKDLEKFPCFHTEYDAYDSSVEIHLSCDAPKLTEEQARQIFDEFGFGIIFENQGEEGRGIYNGGKSFWSVIPHEYSGEGSKEVILLKRRIEKMRDEINKLKNSI